MEKLASYSLKENDLTLDWVNEMDDETIKIEEGLIRIERELRRENLLKAWTKILFKLNWIES